MFGLLNIDKPTRLTSRDAVNQIERLVKPNKVGHAGTLDPIATGVLLVAIGPATRLVPHLHRLPKTYEAEFLFGMRSETDDVEMEVHPVPGAPTITEGDLRGVLPRFLGSVEQVPPRFSAVKILGRPAYKLARRGHTPELTPRIVEIHRIELLRFTPERFTLEIECGTGTYIRSIGRDIGTALGTSTVMSALRRTSIGSFRVEDATPLRTFSVPRLESPLLPARLAVKDLPSYCPTAVEWERLRKGRGVRTNAELPADAEIALLREEELIGIGTAGASGELRPATIFWKQPLATAT